MSEYSARYKKVAAQFTQRVKDVPDDAWGNPAPCEGWTARDVVRHLAEWIPAFLSSRAGLELPDGPSADDDPVGAWECIRDGVQAVLDDPQTSGIEFEGGLGTMSVERAVAMFVTPDVLVHTWDLARAAGLDDKLDPEEVHRMYEGLQRVPEDVLRNSGQFGPRVDVPPDADEQTKLIAYTGRRP